MTTIVVIAPGEMGAAVGRRLHERGARVLTSLCGRGKASAKRARAAGMIAVDDDDALVAQADFVLSIVPPNQAVGLAQRLAAALGRSAGKPIYLDCNAIAPRTAEQVGDIIAATGCRFVDAGIIGPPVGIGRTKIYLSGASARSCEPLQGFGLPLRVLDGPIGAASALKMSYAGITKGLAAIGAAMVLGAIHGGSADALHAELADSQPAVLDHVARFALRLPIVSYRWSPEMQEIAKFLEQDPIARDIYQAIARFYGGVADTIERDPAAAKLQADQLAAFFAKRHEPPT